MAYKFQLGTAKLSGSVQLTDGSIDSTNVDDTTAANIVSQIDAGEIPTAKLANDTISGIALGSNLNSLSKATNGGVNFSSYNGSAAVSDLALDLSDLAAASVDVATDSIAIYDSSADVTGQESIADLMAAVAGEGLASQSGSLGVSTDGSTIEVSGGGNIQIVDGGVTNAKLANSTISGISLGSNLNSLSKATNGGVNFSSYNGSAAVSDLALDLSDLAAAAVNVGADSIAIYDADADVTGQESIADLMTAVAGDALSATSGVLAVAVDDSSVEINADSLRVKALGITNAMLAGSIENAKLSNSDVSLGGVTVALGASDATPAFDLSDATSYPGDSSLVTAGALNAGSITSGFGSINNGSSAITTTGTGSFGKIIVSGDLEVQGALTYIDTTNLRVSDAKVVFADGAGALAAGQGWYIGADDASVSQLASFAVNLDVDGSGTDGFESSLPIKASRFYGELVGAMVEAQNPVNSTQTLDEGDGMQVLADASAASITLTLPGAGQLEGVVYKIKRVDDSGNSVTISAPAGTIDGAGSVVLESGYAAINIISDGTNYYIV